METCHICGEKAGNNPRYIRRRKKASAFTETDEGIAPVCKDCDLSISMSAAFGGR